jgi:hypothetical protein
VRGFYPLDLGRVISVSFSMYRFGWRTFVGIGLVTAIPVALITALTTGLTYQPLIDWERSVGIGIYPPRAQTADALAAFPWWAVALNLASSLAVGPISVIGGAALIDAVVRVFTGERRSIRGSFGRAMRRVRSLIGLYLIVFATLAALPALGIALPVIAALGPRGVAGPILFLALIAFVVAVVAFIFVIIRLTFATQALMIENIGARAAIARSWRLIAGSMWRVIGYVLVLGLLVAVLGSILSLIGTIIGFLVAPPSITTFPVSVTFNPLSLVIQSFVQLLALAVVSPIASVGVTLLYFDIRWRKGEPVPLPGGAESTAPARI